MAQSPDQFSTASPLYTLRDSSRAIAQAIGKKLPDSAMDLPLWRPTPTVPAFPDARDALAEAQRIH